NGAYERRQVLALADAVATRVGVSGFEEPVSCDDLEGLRLLRDRAGGDEHRGPEDGHQRSRSPGASAERGDGGRSRARLWGLTTLIRRSSARLGSVGALTAMLVGAAGCGGRQSILAPRSHQTHVIALIWW